MSTIQKQALDLFLKNQGMTRYQLSKLSGIRDTSLATINKREVDSFKAGMIKKIAVVFGMTAGQLLDELYRIEEE
ncbi:helix-turn-helix domain-containing protein [Listeria ilorinensis]|uniref:helix-turn-helix domain-containing protein n=1 Tax=Listeria ilorinensis TaxID=2867439 RepID=UPI001EF64005|nr:helix-turn-helix domain-containing protein [Listeria ilorinensis]